MSQKLQLQGLRFDNHEAAQDFLIYDSTKTYTTGSVSASADPFSAKVNDDFAQAGGVSIIATAAFHFIWSAAGTAATTSHQYAPANTYVRCQVNPSKPYLRVIPTTGSATFWVTEHPEWPTSYDAA